MLQRLLPFGDCKGSHFFLASKSFSTFFLQSGFFLFHLDGVVRFMPCCVHRFLISGPDLRIDARFSPFPPSSVHRFLISGSDLGIDARFCLFMPSCVHRFLILGGQFGNHCRFFPVYAFLRAVILDLRGSIWESLHGFPGNSLVAAAILDFRPRFANHCSTIVAAVWNGPPAAVVAAEMVRVRF